MQVIGLFLTLLVYKAAARQVDVCYAEDDDPYLFLASKTSYHFVHGGKTRFQTVPGACSDIISLHLVRSLTSLADTHGLFLDSLNTIR